MELAINERPLLKTRISKYITMCLESEYLIFVKNRGTEKFIPSQEENELELLYALFISHLDNFIQQNDYLIGVSLYIYFSSNDQTINHFYKYYETTPYSNEKYVIQFLKELYNQC